MRKALNAKGETGILQMATGSENSAAETNGLGLRPGTCSGSRLIFLTVCKREIRQYLQTPGVYVALHGKVLQFPGVEKDRTRGTFVKT